MKILMVLTSHDQLGDTGKPTGFWLEEFASPYYTFKDAGAEVTLASPAGGQPPIDPISNADDAQTPATERFHQDSDAQQALANTLVLTEQRADDFDALFYPGGHGPLWDLAEDPASIGLIEKFHQQQKPVGAVCHAPGVLRHTRTPAGQPLVAGRRVTGFTNSEEQTVGLTEIVPFLVEDMLKANGAEFSRDSDWSSYVVNDDLLVTGQNPASSEGTAQALIKLVR